MFHEVRVREQYLATTSSVPGEQLVVGRHQPRLADGGAGLLRRGWCGAQLPQRA